MEFSVETIQCLEQMVNPRYITSDISDLIGLLQLSFSMALVFLDVQNSVSEVSQN